MIVLHVVYNTVSGYPITSIIAYSTPPDRLTDLQPPCTSMKIQLYDDPPPTYCNARTQRALPQNVQISQ